MLSHSLGLGAHRQKADGLPPALRIALKLGFLWSLGLQLLLEENHRHLQDVGFLQLGVGILLLELFLQHGFELLDAVVDAISAHLFHHWLSQLVKEERRDVRLVFCVVWLMFRVIMRINGICLEGNNTKYYRK